MSSDSDDGTRFCIRLNDLDRGEERPEIELSIWKRDGDEPIARLPIDEEGNVDREAFELDDALIYRVGPVDADLDLLRETGLNIGAEMLGAALDQGVLDVARPVWEGWRTFFRCVTGSIQLCRRPQWWLNDLVELARPGPSARIDLQPAQAARIAGLSTSALTQLGTSGRTETRISPASTIDDLVAFPTICHPICDATIEVWCRTCCCEPWITFDPRLPELERELEDLIPPGPIPDPIPDPFPFGRPVRPISGPDPIPELPPQFFRDGTLDQRALNAERDLQAIRALNPEEVPAYINARPYLTCLRRSCGTPRRVATGTPMLDGRFNICWQDLPVLLRRGCHREYAYIVRQQFGDLSIPIYNGVAANEWFAAGDTPTLTSYSPLAFGCRPNPPGQFVYLSVIGETGAHQLITPDADGARSVAPPAANSGLVFPDPSTAPSMVTERNWGGVLKLALTIAEGMKDIGARYYRISVTEADANGNAVGTPTPINTGLSWNKAIPGEIVPVSLGPNSVGGQTSLYTIPFDVDPDTNAFNDWEPGQYHALINTVNFNPVGMGNLVPRHLVTVEIFDGDGNRLRPQGTAATGFGGTENEAAFTFERRISEVGPRANVPFGALTNMFWWDNRPAVAAIVDLRQNNIESDAECQFIEGTSSDLFSIGYRAYHEHEAFQRQHIIRWRRGLNGATGTLQAATAMNAGGPPQDAPVAVSASASFGSMLDLSADPPIDKCAFTVSVSIDNKVTDGDNTNIVRTTASAAFALEITS